jgi:hypothetical protein
MATAILTCAALAACSPSDEQGVDVPVVVPEYGTVVTKLLEDDLVSFDVQMKGATTNNDVIAFSDCVAAQYALIRGAGFMRRVRNDVTKKRDVWIGTGIYTLSEAHPGGKYSIDAEVTAAECRANNIPMV